jgi:anti-sigma factor RsiW
MNCIDTYILQSYLDGELSASGKLAVEKHLASCTSCVQRLESLRKRSKIVKGLFRLEEIDPPVFEVNQPMEKHPVLTSRMKQLLFSRWTYALTAACILGAVFLYKPSVCNGMSSQPLLMRQELDEVDANRPYEEQQTVIKLESYPTKNETN